MRLGKLQPVLDSRSSLSVSIVRRNASGTPAANGYQFQHPPAASSCGSVSVSPIPAVCYILLRPPRKLAGPRKNTPDSIRMENTPAPPIALSPIIRLRDWLVKYRVVISTILFVALLGEDALWGRKPHSWLYGETAGLVGLALVVLGLLVRSWSAGVLRKGNQLAETGPYSLCRHPLYLGSALMMFGSCLIIGEWANWLYICGPVAILYWITISKEEARIAAQYPLPWPAYQARVPRVLPWRLDLYVHAEWSAAQWRRNREYQALSGAVVGLALVEIVLRF